MNAQDAQKRAQTGKMGEAFARRLLQEQGYCICAVNFSSRYGEIDIIAQKDGTICFVEVKTRKSGSAVTGECAVTPAKQKKLLRTAMVYLQRFPTGAQMRFDVCSIRTGKSGEILDYTYLTGAFDGACYES